MRLRAPILVTSIILLICITCVGLAQGDGDRLRMLYIGDYANWNPGIVAIQSDPKIVASYVPATTGWFGGAEIQRAMRLYLPRTYSRYIEETDITVLSDADPWSLPDEWDFHIRNSVAEAGRSVLMTGGHRGLGGTGAARKHWDGTKVEQALPVTIVPGSIIGNIGMGATLKPMIAIKDDPLVKSLPWSTCPFLTEVNVVIPKQGAKTPLVVDNDAENPIISYWNYEQGRTLIFAADWHGYATRAMRYWQFFDDAVLNMVYQASNLELPPDPILAHQLRFSFKRFRLLELGLNALVEFTEKFGANVYPVRKEKQAVDDIRREGERRYLKQEYAEALERMEEAMRGLQELEKEAMDLQRSALLWVYAIEWLAVTVTCMVTGFIVYEIMVRRRLYRAVGATKRAPK